MGVPRKHRTSKGFWNKRQANVKEEQRITLGMLLEAEWNKDYFRFEKFDPVTDVYTYYSATGKEIGTETSLQRSMDMMLSRHKSR